MAGVLKYTTNGTTWTTIKGAQGPVGPAGPAGAVAVGRNRFINGDFSINQRGAASVVNGGYVHDRWLLAPYDGTITYSTVVPSAGEINESVRTYARLATTGQTLADCYTQWVQRVEGVRSLAGKQATLSFWARGSVANLKVGFHVTQSFGSGGSASVRTAFPLVPITTGWARYSTTGTIPGIAGMTIGANDFLNCVFWTSAGPNQTLPGPIGIQNATIDFWGMQLEEGPIATLFEQRYLGDELAACQRYFQRWTQPPLRGVISSGSSAGRIGMPLSVPMRTAATAAMSGQWPCYNGSHTGVVTALVNVFTSASAAYVELDVNTNAVWPAIAHPAIIYQGGASYLDLNAEL